VLNQAFEVQQTSAIETALAAHGIRFASYMAPVPFVGLKTSRERSIAADTLDYSYGSYRHAVFVRCADVGCDLRRPELLWESALVPAAGTPEPGQPVTFRTQANQLLTIHNPVTAAMLLQLNGQCLSWSDLVARVQPLLPPQTDIASLADFKNLLAHNHVTPRRRPE
jgi:hypothetical protein